MADDNSYRGHSLRIGKLTNHDQTACKFFSLSFIKFNAKIYSIFVKAKISSNTEIIRLKISSDPKDKFQRTSFNVLKRQKNYSTKDAVSY